MSDSGRRALLVAALGFLQLRDRPPEVAMLHRWLDSWRGLGAVVTGIERQGPAVGVRQWPTTERLRSRGSVGSITR